MRPSDRCPGAVHLPWRRRRRGRRPWTGGPGHSLRRRDRVRSAPVRYAGALRRGSPPSGMRRPPEALHPAAPDTAGRACRPRWRMAWKSLSAPFAEDLLDIGVAENRPLCREAGEGQFSVTREVVIAARRAGVWPLPLLGQAVASQTGGQRVERPFAGDDLPRCPELTRQLEPVPSPRG